MCCLLVLVLNCIHLVDMESCHLFHVLCKELTYLLKLVAEMLGLAFHTDITSLFDWSNLNIYISKCWFLSCIHWNLLQSPLSQVFDLLLIMHKWRTLVTPLLLKHFQHGASISWVKCYTGIWRWHILMFELYKTVKKTQKTNKKISALSKQ